MPNGIIDAAARLFGPGEERLQGLALAVVVDNIDSTGEARVQVQLPWLPGYEPWARVSAVAAGGKRGLYYIPQVGDEVLVGFAHGDVTEPYVLGSLWNGQDNPPADAPNDATSKVILKTPKGHVVELDDLAQTVKVTSIGGPKATLSADKIVLEAGSSKATLESAGKIKLEAPTEISLEAGTKISLKATTIEVKASGNATLDGGGACTIKGGVVQIN
jgi:uncharacterized protein involved in type VI secretion and phage assembly